MIAASATSVNLPRSIAAGSAKVRPKLSVGRGVFESSRRLTPHPPSLGIEQRRALRPGRAAAADDLDREAVIFLRQFPGHIAHGQRLVGPVGITARGHPADDLADMPDRLVA